MAIHTKEEIANYLLNHCFLNGTIHADKEKYYYLINHEDTFREIFQPLGYTIVIHRNLRVIQLINNYGFGKLVLRKYESIMLLLLRLIYIQKRESLSINEDMVFVTVDEIKIEYEKLNLPRKFDKKFLEESLVNLKRYNLAYPLDKLSGIGAKIQIYPSVMLAMSDSSISSAYHTTYDCLQQYKNTKDEEEKD